MLNRGAVPSNATAGAPPGAPAPAGTLGSSHVCCPSGGTYGYRRPRDAGRRDRCPACIRCRGRATKIAASVERSIASFAAHVDIPSEESYMFVLEDAATRRHRRHRRDPRVGRLERHLFLVPQRRDPAGLARPEHQPQRACADAVLGTDRLFAAVRLLRARPRQRRHRSGAAVARAPAVRGAGAAPLRRPLLRAAGRHHRQPTASRRSGMRWAASSSRWTSSTPNASSAARATAP